MVYQPFTDIISGKIIEAIIGVYTGVFPAGFGNVFYVIVMFVGLSLLYIKTQNWGTVAIVGLLISSVTLPFIMAEWHMIAFVFMFLGFLGIFYMIFKSR